MPMPLSPLTMVVGPTATESVPTASESRAAEFAWKYCVGVTDTAAMAPWS
jgi:hypothetical protein